VHCWTAGAFISSGLGERPFGWITADHDWSQDHHQPGHEQAGEKQGLADGHGDDHGLAPSQVGEGQRDRIGAPANATAATGAYHAIFGGDASRAYCATLRTTVLAGGALTAPQLVSEQYVLDLEREAFVSLCGERKTQERIAHTLKTGRPLRN